MRKRFRDIDLRWPAGGCLILIMCVMLADVTGRYVFGSPLLGSIEIARTLLVGTVFLSLAIVQQDKAHVSVDLVVMHLSGRLRRTVDRFGLVIAILTYAFVLYACTIAAHRSYVAGEYAFSAIPVPLWPARSAVVLGLAIFLAQLVADLKKVGGNSD